MLRVVQAALLITLVSLLLVTARGAHAVDSSTEIAQLNNAFKLLQLQLKQTTETAEHISSLLSNLGGQQSRSLSQQNAPEDATKSQSQQQDKQPQEQQQHQHQQRAPGAHAGQESLVAKVDQGSFSRTLAQRVTRWADDFSMLCAIKADTTVTAMAVLAYQPGVLQNQFLVLGDAAGKLYAFNTRGQIAMEHDAGKPIQAMAAIVKTQDKAILVAGLADGTSQVLHVLLSNRHVHLQQQLLKEDVQLLQPPETPPHAPAPVQPLTQANSTSSHAFSSGECENGVDPGATGVMHVGLLRAGAARQVVAALADKQIVIYRENGEVSKGGKGSANSPAGTSICGLMSPFSLLKPFGDSGKGSLAELNKLIQESAEKPQPASSSDNSDAGSTGQITMSRLAKGVPVPGASSKH